MSSSRKYFHMSFWYMKSRILGHWLAPAAVMMIRCTFSKYCIIILVQLGYFKVKCQISNTSYLWMLHNSLFLLLIQKSCILHKPTDMMRFYVYIDNLLLVSSKYQTREPFWDNGNKINSLNLQKYSKIGNTSMVQRECTCMDCLQIEKDLDIKALFFQSILKNVKIWTSSRIFDKEHQESYIFITNRKHVSQFI